MITTIYLIRPGESDGNATHTFCGQTDVPLTARGIAQAECTAAYLRDRPMDFVYASDLRRAFRTGEIAAQAHGLTAQPDPQLREIHGGAWEGQTYDWIGLHYPAEMAVWTDRIGLAQCPGGESVVQVSERITRRVRALAQLHPGAALCLATHALAIRAFIGGVLGKPPAEWHELPWASNASVTTVQYDDTADRFALVEYGADAHLAGMRSQSLA